MTSNDKALLAELFQRYGSPSKETQFQIHGYFQIAESINKSSLVQGADERAARMIDELQEKIDQLNAYRRSLAERYNYLETAPTVPVVRLSRERNSCTNKVFYYLRTFRRFVDSGVEVLVDFTEYSGTERSTAIKAFRAYEKAHPSIIAEMDIQKGRWEK